MNIKMLLEYLFERQNMTVAAKSLADVFDRLFWCLDENAEHEIIATQCEWLRGEDIRKIEIALEMDEVFVSEDREKLEELYSSVCKKRPQFKGKCDAILARFDEQMKGK